MLKINKDHSSEESQESMAGVIRQTVDAVQKRAQWAGFVWATVLLVIGLILLIRPDSAMLLVCRLVGVALFVYGAYQIVRFIREGIRSAGDLSLLSGLIGILLLVLGVYIMQHPEILVNIVTVLLAIFILAHGIYSAVRYGTNSNLRDARWWLCMVSAIALILLGIVFLLAPFESSIVLLRLAGLFLLYAGVMSILYQFRLHRKIAEAEKRVEQGIRTLQENVVDWLDEDDES